MVIKFSSCSILEKYAFSSKKLLTFVSLWCGEDGTVLPFNLLDTALDSIDVVADLLHLQNSNFHVCNNTGNQFWCQCQTFTEVSELLFSVVDNLAIELFLNLFQMFAWITSLRNQLKQHSSSSFQQNSIQSFSNFFDKSTNPSPLIWFQPPGRSRPSCSPPWKRRHCLPPCRHLRFEPVR